MNATFLVLTAYGVLAVQPGDAAKLYEEHSISMKPAGQEQAVTFKYRLLKPETIEPGKKYPLVLFLHGAGERGGDNQSQLKYLPAWLAGAEYREKYPCFVLAPQCRADKKWTNVDWGAKDPTYPKDMSDEMQTVVEMLKQTREACPVDPDRIYLTGLSMGGYGSWDLAARMPETFAAAAPICGGGEVGVAEKLVKVPLWAWHGDADNAVPVERSRKMIEAIKKAGGDPKYTELKGVGHDSWTRAYTDPEGVVPWMFQQKKGKS